MSYTNIVTRIDYDVGTVTGTGMVYELKKNVHDEHEKSRLFKSSGKLHVWFVYRDGAEPSLDFHTLVTRRNRFVIEGYYSHKLRTETEKTFQGLVDDICNEIVNDRLLGGYGYVVTPPVATVTDEVMFTNILCDHAKIEFDVLTTHSAGAKDMIYTGTETFLSSAARTTSSNSSGFDVEKYNEGIFYIYVTVATGQLKCFAQSSSEDDNYADISEYDVTITDTGNYAFRLPNFGKYLRFRYEISGSGASFTFSVTFEGKNNYGI